MAERARQRAAAALPPVYPGNDDWDRLRHEWRLQRARILAELPTTMTLGEATDRLREAPFGCACPGPPVCCWEVTAFARQTVAMAQQVANHFAALIDMRRVR